MKQECTQVDYLQAGAYTDYLTFDATGNEKTLAALKASTRTDHLRALVEGTRDGDTIKVTSMTLE